MPKDRIKLSDARALIAEGQSPEKIAESFDIEDDDAAAPAAAGNIDLHHRPVVKNPDGSISTVRSKSFNMDGKEVLLPTISDDGRHLSDGEAVALYRRTGKHLGVFNSPAEATAYAKRLHEQQDAEYAAAPSPHVARVANIARARLKDAGTTPEEIRRKAAAGEDVAPNAPTMYERTASDVAALVAGTGELLGSMITTLPGSMANIALAPVRGIAASGRTLMRGGSLMDAAEAARNVKPEYAITGVMDPKAAADDAESAIRRAVGVRDKVVVPQTDIMREVPNVIATADGIGHMTARVVNIFRSKGLSVPEASAPGVPAQKEPGFTPEEQALADQAGAAQAEAATKPQTPRTALERAHRDAMALADERAGITPEDSTPPPDNVRPIRPTEKPPETAPEATTAQAASAAAANSDIAAGPKPASAAAVSAMNAEREAATRGAYRQHVSPLDEVDVDPGERYPVERFFDKASGSKAQARGRAIYDGFAKWRQMARSVYGDTIRLVRYGSERPERTVLHWNDPTDTDFTSGMHATEGTRQRQLITRDVPIDDIVAAPHYGEMTADGLPAKQEFLVLNRKSPSAIVPGEVGPTPPGKPPAGGGGNGGSTPPAGGSAPPPPLPPAVRSAASEPTPPPPALPDVEAPDYNPAVRTRYTGSRDIRKAEANTVSNFIKETVPGKLDREALLVRRAFKGDPTQLDRYADGTHPNLDKPGARDKIGALSDVIDKARNPTPAMLQADAVLDQYFTKTLGEGRELGFLDSSITPEEYINHLLQPGDAATVSDGGYSYGQGGGVRRTTPHAMKRGYGNVLEAIANGAAPRTLDAADAVSIYGDRHGHAAATRILENTLKDSDLGKVLTSGNVPEGWKKLGGENSPWDREVPYHDRGGDESKLAVAHQSLYVPEKIAKALKPITDPNYLLEIPGYRGFQRFQDYIKSANVALAFFHLKAETINAFSNMKRGPVDMAKAFMTPLDDPGFLSTERTAIHSGMQTSIVGQTAEAYRALEPKAMPTKIDAIRNLPVMRQLDAAAQATSRLTFDIAIRTYKVIDFASQDAAWIAQHPEATPVELARARRSIAREVNAVYGGLNWEALGINRTIHALMRAFMFAPDWAYSNVETVNMALTKGGPGGAAARWFMARSIAGGMAATAAMTYFLTGKKPGEVPGRMRDKLFNVYMGKDGKGNDKFMNLFFAAAPSDAINFAGNVVDYGAGRGAGATVANKMATVPRALGHVFSNKDFIGRDIVPKDAGFVAGTAISIKNGVTDLAPLPFGATNALQMMLDQKREYTPLEYAAAIGGGVRPRHVTPPSGKPERERNSVTDIIMGAPVHKGRTPYISPYQRAMDKLADKLTTPKKGG